MNRKILTALAVIPAAALVLAGCTNSGTPSGQAAENATSQQDLQTYEQVQPAPHFSYSQIRQTEIDAQASEALGEQTTSFFFNLGVRNPIFSCPSIGDPVPNTAQLTNPNQVVYRYASSDGTGTAVGNIDPNGLYAPSDSSGTNVMCVNAQGDQYLQYWEGDVDTVNGAATWNDTTGQIDVTGQPTMPKCKVASKATTCTK